MAQGARGTSGVLRSWQVFSDSNEGVRLQQNDALTAAAEDAAVLPGTHEATHRIQRRPGHLGDVLTGHWEVDFDTRSDPAPSVSNQSEQGTGDTTFDTLRHQMTVPALQVVQTPGDETDGVDRDRRVRCDYVLHRDGGPCQRDRRLNGLGAHWINWIAERSNRSECVSRADMREDDLVS